MACYPQFAYAYPQQQQISAQVAVAVAQAEDSKQQVVAPPPPVMAMVQPVLAYASQPAYTYAYAMPNYPVPVYSSSPQMTAAVKVAAPASETKKVTASASDNKKVSATASARGTKKVVTKVSAKVASSSAKASTKSDQPSDKSSAAKVEKPTKVMIGRTKKQVDEDNVKLAINEGIYNPNEIVPKDAKPDQLFWVVEADGSNTLRAFSTIEAGVLGKGVWKIDPRYGNAYFVRAKEEESEE